MTVRKRKSTGSDDNELARLRKKVRQLEDAVAANRETIEALRDGEEQVRAIVEHSTDLFYLHTPVHLLKYVSPSPGSSSTANPRNAGTLDRVPGR